MIDFHSHLDLYPNALELLPQVVRRNVFTLVVSTSPRAWISTSKVFAGHANLHVALGLHPEIALQKAAELPLLIRHVEQAKFIGEIGLDGSSRFSDSFPLQRSILDAVLTECERAGGRVMSLHSRNAASQVLDALAAHPNAGVPILHWFSGTLKELHRAINEGAWFSVGPSMLAGEKGRRIASEMPVGRVLLETDGPFATRADGSPWLPWDAERAVDDLAVLWKLSAEIVRDQLLENLGVLLQKADVRGADGIGLMAGGR